MSLTPAEAEIELDAVQAGFNELTERPNDLAFISAHRRKLFLNPHDPSRHYFALRGEGLVIAASAPMESPIHLLCAVADSIVQLLDAIERNKEARALPPNVRVLSLATLTPELLQIMFPGGNA